MDGREWSGCLCMCFFSKKETVSERLGGQSRRTDAGSVMRVTLQIIRDLPRAMEKPAVFTTCSLPPLSSVAHPVSMEHRDHSDSVPCHETPLHRSFGSTKLI